MAVSTPELPTSAPWERRLSRAGIIAGSATATREDIIWFATVFVLSIAGGVWFLYGAEIFVGDAVSRTANAHHVVLSRDPHLAAIGFIWPPMPSFLQLPLVLILRPLGLVLFAPQILGALFTAALAVLLNRTFLLLRVSDWRRWLLTASVLLNPLMLYGAINGMTENIFLFFVLGTAYYLLIWLEQSATTLIITGTLVGLSFFVRYEGLALGAGGVLALVLLSDITEDQDRGEAYLISFLAPLALAGLLWAFWNALFVGDALFFLRSVGSNEFYTGGIREADAGSELARAFNDIPRTVLFAIRRLWSVFPLFLPAALAATGVAIARRDRELAVLLSIGLCLPAFAIFQVYRGELFEWVRFWQPAVLFAPLLAVAALRHVPIHVRRHLVLGVAVVGFLSSVLTGITLGGSVASPDEQQFIGVLTRDLVGDSENSNAHIYEGLREAAEVIDALPDVGGRPPRIAIDTFVHSALVLMVDHPASLVIVSDRDFNNLLDDLRAQVDYLLMPEPVGISASTDLNRRFPALYLSGGTFVELTSEFEGLGGHGDARLYRVLRQPFE